MIDNGTNVLLEKKLEIVWNEIFWNKNVVGQA